MRYDKSKQLTRIVEFNRSLRYKNTQRMARRFIIKFNRDFFGMKNKPLRIHSEYKKVMKVNLKNKSICNPLFQLKLSELIQK